MDHDMTRWQQQLDPICVLWLKHVAHNPLTICTSAHSHTSVAFNSHNNVLYTLLKELDFFLKKYPSSHLDLCYFTNKNLQNILGTTLHEEEMKVSI